MVQLVSVLNQTARNRNLTNDGVMAPHVPNLSPQYRRVATSGFCHFDPEESSRYASERKLGGIRSRFLPASSCNGTPVFRGRVTMVAELSGLYVLSEYGVS
jgi:hypothetical protein